MKSFLFTFLISIISLSLFAQKKYGDLYHPEADAAADLELVMKKAAEEGKQVFVKIGGNWCVWCYRFHDFMEEDEELKTMLEENYVVYHLNYSGENKNEEWLKKFNFPQRFGFPVFVILDAEGNRLHTQDSALLEKEKSYDKNKIKGFLMSWTKKAVDPATYEK